MPRDVIIAPSILAADFSRIGEEVRAVDEAGADFATICREHLSRDATRSVAPRPSAVNFYNDAYEEYLCAVDKVAALYS